MEDYNQLKELIVELKEDVKSGFKENKEEHKSIREYLTENYVTKERFNPVEKLVYGGVSIILVTVITAIVALVVKAST